MKDLLHLLIFKKLYPETEHKARIVDAITGVVVWVCVGMFIQHFVKAIQLWVTM